MILRNSATAELSKEAFLARWEKDENALELYPDELIRNSVAEGLWNNKEHFNAAKADVWPKSYSCRFIEPGLVNYKEYGTVLVQKTVLDKMKNSFVGKPVINVIHKDVTPGKFREEADGVITRVWYNESDGWYWAEFLVWDKATMLNCESPAYSVSCAYAVTNSDEKPGEYHNIPYAQEVIDGEYTHLAIVSNPRYEGARIVYNSKGGSMKLFNWFKKGETKQPADVEKAVVDVDGKKVTMKELIDVHNAREAAGKGTTTDQTLDNMSDDTLIEIDGKEMPLKNLKDAYRKNAEDDEEKKKKDAENLKNAEEDEKKKKDAEMKNAADAKAKADADAETLRLKNEKEAEEARKGTEHFNSLKDAASRRGEPQQPVLTSRRELAALGNERYGVIKK